MVYQGLGYLKIFSFSFYELFFLDVLFTSFLLGYAFYELVVWFCFVTTCNNMLVLERRLCNAGAMERGIGAKQNSESRA